MMKTKALFAAFAAVVCVATAAQGGQQQAVSPDGRNRIAYSEGMVTVSRDGRTLFGPQPAVLRLDHGKAKVELCARNDGVAYRFATDEKGEITVLDETAALVFPSPDTELWVGYNWCDNPKDPKQDKLQHGCASAYTRTTPSSFVPDGRRIAYLPLTVRYPDGTAALVTETDLRDYAGWHLKRRGSETRRIDGVFGKYPIRNKELNKGWKWPRYLRKGNMTNTRLLTIVAAICGAAMAVPSWAAEPIPAFILGQNVEHTRSAVQGGLSAQLVRNRKFAGRPQRNGVALMWEPCGDHAFYHLMQNRGLTRHAARSRMPRVDEINSQVIGCLATEGDAGILQRDVGVRGGVTHTFRAVVSNLHDEDTPVVLRVSSGGCVLAEREFTVRSKNVSDWKRMSFDFTLERDTMAEIAVLVKGKRYIVVGAVSVMPSDNFRGMRADVVEHLREIGTSVVRWPGGNFAGEYRWRDGLIADPDERAPLQSRNEIKTHPYTLGYDSNDIGMEDVIALCEKIGAKPFFTINIGWDSPADSADWVKTCRGRVKLWGLGNEIGHGHMEGVNEPQGYTKVATQHAEAMLKVDPSLKFIASGARNWEPLGLKCVCYFQPVNEQAICVNPFESHLTAAGEAMRLWKGHVGGVPAPMVETTSASAPENAFTTDHPDGSRYMTFYNFSVEKPCTFRIPIGGRGKIVAEETLVPNGFEIGCRFERKQGTGKIVGGFYELTLAPASLSCARLIK